MATCPSAPYDTVSDRGERTNLAEAMPEELEQLEAPLERIRQQRGGVR